MNIRDRLSQLARHRTERPRPERQDQRRDEAFRFPLQELIPGEEVSNEKGSFFCTQVYYPGSFRHGLSVLRDYLPMDTSLLAVLAGEPSIEGWGIQDGLFLDTETTGLSGGTGTLPFLIGLGWFEKDAFVIHQIFIRDYDEEKAALLHLTNYLEQKRFLISFNGKAFDANLLNTRFILSRLPPLLEDMPHLDLLHPARRLFKDRLNDRSLSALEQAIVGLTREGDVSGAEIPFLYFDWLRRRDARLMVRVFEHNRLDILSLVALTAKLAELINPEAEGSASTLSDRLAAGRLWACRGITSRAISLLEAVRCREEGGKTWFFASRELSLIYRRLRRWPEAVAVWQQMVERDPSDTFALIELAKYYEHQVRNFEIAMKYALRAHRALPSSPEINHRLERLLRKLSAR